MIRTMEFHELANKVCTGNDESGIYRIWPSAKHKGYFYVDRVVYPPELKLFLEGKADIPAAATTSPIYAESAKRPMNITGVNYWINKYAPNIEWKFAEWDGKEFNYFEERPVEKSSEVVYFIEAVGTKFVKIGRSDSSDARLKALQTASPFVLKLVHEIETMDSQKLEGELHKQFAKYHHLNEWYVFSKEIKDYILENINANR